MTETGVNMARKIKEIYTWIGSNSRLFQQDENGPHKLN